MAGGTHTMSVAWDQQNGRASMFGVSASKPLPLSLFGEVDEEEERQAEEATQVHENGWKDDDEDEFGEFECVVTDQSGNGVRGEVEVVDKSGKDSTNLVGFGNFENAGNVDRVDVRVDGFGKFDEASKRDEVGSNEDFKVNGSPSSAPEHVEDDRWAFSTPTSEWMLEMHGIHSGPRSRKQEEVLLPSFSNGHMSSLSIPKLTPPDPSDDDEWGEFAGPAVLTSTKEAERDMIDLISMLEEVPAEQTSLPSTTDAGSSLSNDSDTNAVGDASTADSGAFDLLSTSDTREVCEPGEDLFGFQFQEDASCKAMANASSTNAQNDFDLLLSLEQPAGVSSNETKQEDLFGLSVPQNVSGIRTKDADRVIDESSETKFDNGFVDVNWGVNLLHARADGLSRSVSLPVTDADEKTVSLQRTQSNGSFLPNFSLIEEWPLEPTNASVASLFEGTGHHDEKKTEPNLMEALLGIDDVKDEKPKTNCFIDLLDLDWEYKNSTDTTEEPPADVQLATDTKADSATDKQPRWYLGKWIELSRVCASELEQGAQIWNEAKSAQCESELVSVLEGENYFKALLQVYRVYLILRATSHNHSSWLDASLDQSAEFKLCMDRSRQAWAGLKDVLKLLGLQEPVYPETLVSLETPTCALTLVSLQSIPDVPSTIWDGHSYFLPVANLWANRISSRPFDV